MNHAKWMRLGLLGIVVAGIVLAAALVPPIPQPAEYHRFADQRTYFGIPNFFNVVSNAAFMLVGAAGLAFLLRRRGMFSPKIFVESSERWPYLILFLGVVLASLGSAYYHWAPDNERLAWDRLPIALCLTALVAATLAERVSLKVGLSLLPVLIAGGIGSVLYWYWSEQRGAGNLNFYVAMQICSLLAILLLGILFPPRYRRGTDLYAAMALYALALLAELADREIYALGQGISGHTVKHLLAALAVYRILRMLQKRSPLP